MLGTPLILYVLFLYLLFFAPPLKRGISAILVRYPMKTRQMGATPPSAILSRKGIARYGGVSRTGPLSSVLCFLGLSGKKKTNKHKHFRRDGVRDKQQPSLGQMGPLPGTKWDPSLGQTGLSLLNSTVKSPFCPVCPWDRWGFIPGTIVPQGPSEKCLCVFCLLVFLLPTQRTRPY